MTRMLLLVACVLAAFPACRVAPPAAVVRRDFGVVRAATWADADRVSRYAEALLADLQELLPDVRERELEVWVQKEIALLRGSPYPEHIAGMADYENARIHLRENDDRIRLHLAHELVHVLLGPTWEPLPGLLEEGVCDLAAALLVQDLGPSHHVKRLVEASGFMGGVDAVVDLSVPETQGEITALSRRTLRVRLSFDADPDVDPEQALLLDEREVFEHATDEDGVGLYGLSYVIVLAVVRRVGFDGLNGLCLRAAEEGLERVPSSWILRAAGLPQGERAFQAALSRLLGPDDLPALADVLSASLAASLVEAARDAYPDHDANRFLEVARPSLGLAGYPHRVPLIGVPEFESAVRSAWVDPAGSTVPSEQDD